MQSQVAAAFFPLAMRMCWLMMSLTRGRQHSNIPPDVAAKPGGPMKRCLLPALATALLLLVCFGPTQGGDKLKEFFVFPPEVYKVLTERSVKAIEETAKGGGEGAAAKIDAEAL